MVTPTSALSNAVAKPPRTDKAPLAAFEVVVGLAEVVPDEADLLVDLLAAGVVVAAGVVAAATVVV